MKRHPRFWQSLVVLSCMIAAAEACGSSAAKCTAVASCNLKGTAPSVGGQVAGHCREYAGSMWTASTVQATCPANVGTYLEGCCPLDSAIAKCIVAPGTLNEWVDYYYADKGWKLGEAEQICKTTNTGNNTFVILDGSSGPTSTTSTSASTGGGVKGSCASVCKKIVADCSAILEADCLKECQDDEANAASCKESAKWQTMLDCCEAVTDYKPHCSKTRFDPCQTGACKDLRPAGAADGCK